MPRNGAVKTRVTVGVACLRLKPILNDGVPSPKFFQNWSCLSTILVVYQGHGIFLPVSSFYVPPHQFLGGDSSSEIEG